MTDKHIYIIKDFEAAYPVEVKENAANYVAEQLEIQYEKMVNEEVPFGKHFCNETNI